MQTVADRKLALGLVIATAAVLMAMIGVSLVTGASQELHEHYAPPAQYAQQLLAHPGGLRLMMGLDVAFLCLYTAFFAALARVLDGRPFVRLALAAMVAVALLDIIEDHRILASLGQAESGHALDDSTIAWQQVISSTKFSISYLSLALFGLAIPRTTRVAWALALFLVVGNLATGVLGFAAPPAWWEALDASRWVGFLAGFVLAGAWLYRDAEADPRATARPVGDPGAAVVGDRDP